ncbi:MAG TPA: hypothetical protein PKI61_02475 [bacterium]|nr:hypothetical protein [bacterium]HPT30130.1 hypothetical protein [bacterium]
MSHEIEADFVTDWGTVASQCRNCTSFQVRAEGGFCTEAQSQVPETAHCDFFQSRD